MDKQYNNLKNRSAIGLLLGIFILASITISAVAANGSFLSLTDTKKAAAQKNTGIEQLPLTQQPTMTINKPISNQIADTKETNKISMGSFPLSRSNTVKIATSASSEITDAPVILSTTVNKVIPAVAMNTIYTTQSLATHNKAGDCYVAYQGKIYDMSKQTAWSTCNDGGVLGGTDVTANFPQAEYYFTSFPQIGVYQNTSTTTPNTTSTAATNNTNTNSNKTSNTTNTNTTTTTQNNTTRSNNKSTYESDDDNGSDDDYRTTPSATVRNSTQTTTTSYKNSGHHFENDD